MVINPLLALLLGLVPGLGHFAARRKVRGFIYPFLIFVVWGFGFLLALDGDADTGPIIVTMIIIGIIIWLINFFDLAVYLVRIGQQGGASKGPSSPYAGGIGSFPDSGGLHAYPPGPYGIGARTAGPPPLSGFASGEDAGASRQDRTAGEAASGFGEQPARPAGYGGNGEARERFYTILLSFVPGLGHLQLGLMQRGLTLMTGFFGLLVMIVFVSILTQESGFLTFLFALPVVWLYGMFDAIRHVQQKQIGIPLHDRSILDDWDEHRQDGRRSRWFATVLSVLPGAGHMYLGLQKRGLQLMAGFLLAIYLLDLLQLSLFLFIVPLIWCFAFFDALQLQSRYREAGAPPEDIPVVEWLVYRRRWIGLGLLALGLYYLADRLLFDVLQEVIKNYRVTDGIQYYFKTGLSALLLIGIGLKLLVGGTGMSKRLRDE